MLEEQETGSEGTRDLIGSTPWLFITPRLPVCVSCDTHACVEGWIRLWRLRPEGADPRLPCLGKSYVSTQSHRVVMTMIYLLVIAQHDSRWCSIRESRQRLTSTQVPTRLSFVNASKALCRRVGRLVQCVLFPNFCYQPYPTPACFS